MWDCTFQSSRKKSSHFVAEKDRRASVNRLGMAVESLSQSGPLEERWTFRCIAFQPIDPGSLVHGTRRVALF